MMQIIRKGVCEWKIKQISKLLRITPHYYLKSEAWWVSMLKAINSSRSLTFGSSNIAASLSKEGVEIKYTIITCHKAGLWLYCE